MKPSQYKTLKDFKGLKIKKGKIVPYEKSVFILHETAKIELNGNLVTNANCIIPNGRSTIIRLDEGSLLKVNGNFSIFYGGDIILMKGAVLEIGGGYCNSNFKIRVKGKVKIGSRVAIAHDVTILDSNFHPINGVTKTNPVIIGDHVWIGTRVTILRGVTIGDGAIIGAGAVVTKDIPSRCLAVGNPAVIVKENVTWG